MGDWVHQMMARQISLQTFNFYGSLWFQFGPFCLAIITDTPCFIEFLFISSLAQMFEFGLGECADWHCWKTSHLSI